MRSALGFSAFEKFDESVSSIGLNRLLNILDSFQFVNVGPETIGKFDLDFVDAANVKAVRDNSSLNFTLNPGESKEQLFVFAVSWTRLISLFKKGAQSRPLFHLFRLFYTINYGGRHSKEVAFTILTQPARIRFSAFPRSFTVS